MRDRREEHLDANEKLLHRGGHLRGVVVRLRLPLRNLDPLHLNHEQQGLALPKGEEHDGFYRAEFIKGPNGRESKTDRLGLAVTLRGNNTTDCSGNGAQLTLSLHLRP